METPFEKLHLASAATILAFTCWFFPGFQSRAAEPTPPPAMPKCCMRMNEMHADFLKMIKEQDTELAVQAEKMRVATGSAKQELIEATLLMMIQQQSAQHAEMEKMITEMKSAKRCCPMMRN